MLCEKNGKRDSDTERRIYYTDDVLPSSLIMTPYRLRHYDAFRSPLLVTCFPKIVIQNGGKNALWERQKTEQ